MDKKLIEKICVALLIVALFLVLSLQCGCATEYQRQNYGLMTDLTKKIAGEHPSELTQVTSDLAQSIERVEGSPVNRLPATIEQAEMRTTQNNDYANQGYFGWIIGMLPLLLVLERVMKMFTGKSAFGVEMLLGYIGINPETKKEIENGKIAKKE
jgi:hypothetical protein